MHLEKKDSLLICSLKTCFFLVGITMLQYYLKLIFQRQSSISSTAAEEMNFENFTILVKSSNPRPQPNIRIKYLHWQIDSIKIYFKHKVVFIIILYALMVNLLTLILFIPTLPDNDSNDTYYSILWDCDNCS